MGFSCSAHSGFHLGEPDVNFCGVLLFSVSSAGVRFLLLFPAPFSVVGFQQFIIFSIPDLCLF